MIIGNCRKCKQDFEYVKKRSKRSVCGACKKATYKAYQKAYQKAYEKSDKCKATRKAYCGSGKGKAVNKIWRDSEYGKARRKVYHERGKATRKAYEKSDKGKANIKARRESDHSKAYARTWQRERRANDPQYRLNRNISRSISLALKDNKNGRHWESLVGYTVADLKKHLQKLFTADMTWDNYGKWHMDHVIAKIHFNYTKPEHADFKRCWALKNLQPMWASPNISKGAKLDKHFQPSLLLKA